MDNVVTWSKYCGKLTVVLRITICNYPICMHVKIKHNFL